MIAPRFPGWRASVNRYAALYLVTLLVIVPLDFLFLGVVAKDFFTSQVGNMLGEIKLVPAILFYLLYVVGTVVFVSKECCLDLWSDRGRHFPATQGNRLAITKD